MVTISTFNAVGRPLAALSLTLAEMACLYVPAAYLLSWWLGLDGVFIGGLAAFLGAGAASYLWSRRILAEPGEP